LAEFFGNVLKKFLYIKRFLDSSCCELEIDNRPDSEHPDKPRMLQSLADLKLDDSRRLLGRRDFNQIPSEIHQESDSFARRCVTAQRARQGSRRYGRTVPADGGFP
jgi:hypothetical protein